MATLKYDAYGSSIAIFGNTELASMGNGNYTFGNGAGLSSNVFDNTSLLYPEADVIVKLGSITPSAGGFIALGFLWSLDGTDFDDPQYASGQAAGNAPIGGAPIYTRGLTTTTSAKIVIFPRILLRPGKAKIVIGNLSGGTLNAAGNTAAMYPATYDVS